MTVLIRLIQVSWLEGMFFWMGLKIRR